MSSSLLGEAGPGYADMPGGAEGRIAGGAASWLSNIRGAWSGHTRIARWLNPPARVCFQLLGAALVVVWCLWMIKSFERHHLKSRQLLIQSYFGVDFYHHIDRHARTLWNGGAPYTDQEFICAYPPFVLHLFSWVNLTNSRQALAIWLGMLAAILAAGGWVAVKTRRQLRLETLPTTLAVAAVLFSTPVLFAMDRGQCDPLSVLYIILALPLLSHRSQAMQFLAGVLLCLAPWTKVYPALLFVALVGLRRWRALGGFVIGGAVLGLLDFSMVRQFFEVNKEHMAIAVNLSRFPYPDGGPCPWNHSLPLAISNLLFHTRLDSRAVLLGQIGAAALLLPLLGWVSWHVWQCPRRCALAYPYMLWVVALATFVPPISNDYNICVLPLAVLAVWNRRDPLLVQAALALLFLWWQPLDLGISGRMMLVFKLLGLAATGVCLAERAAELSFPPAEGADTSRSNHRGLEIFGLTRTRHLRSEPRPVATAAGA